MTAKGVLRPEGPITPADFIELATKVMFSGAAPGEQRATLRFETVHADGSVTTTTI